MATSEGPGARRARLETAASANRIRVVLAIFDFPMLNLGFRAAIEREPDMEIVAQITERDRFVEQLPGLEAEVVITECGPLCGAGRMSMDAIEAVRAALPAARILALEGGSGSERYSLALRAGAAGFVTRDVSPADVVSAIRCLDRGETYVSAALVTKMVNTYVLRTSPRGNVEDAYDGLSDREREVLLLAATGHTNREIAKIFRLSEQTIHNYRAAVMEKLGFHDRVDLLKYAIRRGVISVSDL
jgi:DNA-binding NarL/FixJ family response regulator